MIYNIFCFFFFNDTATTEIYTLSLHDALPISADGDEERVRRGPEDADGRHRRGNGERREGDGHHDRDRGGDEQDVDRSEEHTSELQSRQYLVCRLLLEKKKKNE